MKADVISILEAAYDEPSDQWFNNVVVAMQPSLDCGYGVHGHVFRADRQRDITTVKDVTVSSDASSAKRAARVTRTLFSQWPPVNGVSTISSTRQYPPVPWAGLFSKLTGQERPMYLLDSSGRAGSDGFGILAGDPSGDGVCVTAYLDESSKVNASERRLWTMIAVHLAAGYRLLRGRRTERVDAILRADGRVEHAEDSAKSPVARESLQCAAKGIDRARGRLRRASPDEAVELWRGLVDGTWSLVDHVDADGKRFLFAKRNLPDVRPWRNLTPREEQVLAYAAYGHSHKLIGYELGISESASARHLASAARKVRAQSRLELIRAYRNDNRS